jgi:hypothetical protein
MEILNNWRSAHSYPLQVIMMTLRRRAEAVDPACLVSQRLKRFRSIQEKLSREPTMKLSQMHDIGGCRAVLSTCDHVDELVRLYTTRASNSACELHRAYDYITGPKHSGYRSVHLVHKYQSRSSTIRATYNGLRVEVQIRSKLQHAWATAVETASAFTNQALKSSCGEVRWKRFFALMGSVIALEEGRLIVPGTPADRDELINELKSVCRELNVERILSGGSAAINISSTERELAHAVAYLLVLNSSERTVAIEAYDKRSIHWAEDVYASKEKQYAEDPDVDVVLVWAKDLNALRSAYPNYYLDTDAFLQVLRRATA